VIKPLACLLALLAGTAAVRADNLVAKRVACVDAAKARITARSTAGSEVYRLMVERRRAFVEKCMVEVGPSASPRNAAASAAGGQAGAAAPTRPSRSREPLRQSAPAASVLRNG
jgi:hypothetical protein